MSPAQPLRTLAAAGLCIVLAACGASPAKSPGAEIAQRVASAAGRLNGAGLARLEHGMGLGGLALAARFDPAPHVDAWGRPAAWTSLDLARAPTLAWGDLSQADAAVVNAALPVDDAGVAPAQPFYLGAAGSERDRAILCMTQAVYYEAGLEPLEGEQAVAQTVINRMRHPDFPKSVCGVVYQGSQMLTGCQFSFTCDGSLARTPMEPYWSRAKQVAEAALDGFVAKAIGPATNYHADYVLPRWGPQMVKIVQLGAHIFYRFPGPAGLPRMLDGRYAGHELEVAMTGPAEGADRASLTALAESLAAAPPTLLTAQSAARPASASAPMLPPTPGQVVGGRRIPTRQEIARINAQLPPFANDTPVATAGGDGR
jgi:spore germination cell wall hydrolase CwlJ-like protein